MKTWNIIYHKGLTANYITLYGHCNQYFFSKIGLMKMLFNPKISKGLEIYSWAYELLNLFLSFLCFHGFQSVLLFLLRFIPAIHYLHLFGFVIVPFFVVISAQLVAQEEKLRLEEEAIVAAQREAARLAKERKLKEVRRPHWARPTLLLPHSCPSFCCWCIYKKYIFI